MPDSALRSFFNNVIFVPLVIIISWEGKRAGSVTIVGRACYEIFGACAEAQYQPPALLIHFCVRNLPGNVSLETAKDVSSIVTVQRNVMKNLNRLKYEGVMSYLNHFTLKDLMKLTDAANWVRIIPSMFIASPQLRGGMLTLYVTTFFFSVPVKFSQLGTACHITALVVLGDLVWWIMEAPTKERRVWRARKEALFIGLQIIAPIIMVLFTAMMMLVVAYLVDAAHGLIDPESHPDYMGQQQQQQQQRQYGRGQAA